MKLIKLHLADNQPVWINPKSVCSVGGNNVRGGVVFIGGGDCRIILSETPEEIVKLLEETK